MCQLLGYNPLLNIVKYSQCTSIHILWLPCIVAVGIDKVLGVLKWHCKVGQIRTPCNTEKANCSNAMCSGLKNLPLLGMGATILINHAK